MKKIFFLTNCKASNLALDFIEKNSIIVDKKNVSYQEITEKELLDMEVLIPNGMVDLINMNSHTLETLEVDIKNLSKKELMYLIIKNPTILSYPIMYESTESNNPSRLVVGFNPTEWEIFTKKNHKEKYYANINKFFKFKECCFFDEAKKR